MNNIIDFTIEESALIASCDGSRLEIIEQLRSMRAGDVDAGEGQEWLEEWALSIAKASAEKLERMTDEEFSAYDFGADSL